MPRYGMVHWRNQQKLQSGKKEIITKRKKGQARVKLTNTHKAKQWMYERIREMMTAMMNSKVLESGTNISGRNYLQDGRDDQSKAFLRLCIIQAEN